MSMNIRVTACLTMATFGLSAMAISAPPIGMMNWVTYPIMNDSDRATMVSFVNSSKSPSIAGGWVVQEIADTIQGGANYAHADSFVQAMDDAGVHLSLNYGDTDWNGSTTDVNQNVTVILTYLDNCNATLSTNVINGSPTIDVNLDVEPKGGTTTQQWISMLSQVRALLDTHNAGSPKVKATLSAFVPMSVQDDLEANQLWSQAWANADTLIVMAYRNLPCFTTPCTGTDTAPCADGFMKWGLQLATNTPSGKHCAIALELDPTGDDIGANCWKISFGTTGIYNHPHSTDPESYRRNFLNEAIQEGWDMLSSAQQQKFHPYGAFILHSYQWLSCFRDNVQITGGGACSSSGACGDQSKCIPQLAQNTPDLNHDGVVNAADLDIMYDAISSCAHDSNTDGMIDIEDLMHMLQSWGPCQ
ncbi:MAG: hypothetical protein MK077_01030 [Phycisphaerales bacterium]|nr:hypothetical protein [Phycisphaerales bacterium]